MKVTLKEGINNYIEDNYPDYLDDILLADGFEEAFMGVTETFGAEPRACYDSAKCIDILIRCTILQQMARLKGWPYLISNG